MRVKSFFALQPRWMPSVQMWALLPFVLSVTVGLWLYQSAAGIAEQKLGQKFLNLTQEFADATEERGHLFEGILNSLGFAANHLKRDGKTIQAADYLQSLASQAVCSERCQFGFTTSIASGQGGRRDAMTRALETHAAFVYSEPPLIGPEPATPGHHRLTLFMPVPVDHLQPDSATVLETAPLVFMSLDADALLEHAEARLQTDIAWEIFDRELVSADAVPLLRSAVPQNVAADHVPLFSVSRGFHFGGKAWTLRLHSLPAFEAKLDDEQPRRFLRNMSILGVLLSIIAWLEISSRKRAQDTVNRKTSELNILARAVDQNPVATVIANDQGTIEYVSVGYTRMSGFSVQDLIGKPINVLQSHFTSDAEREQLWKYLRADKVWKGIIQSRRKNGTLYWESQTISALRDAQGSVTHLMVTKENITEQKQSEERMQRNQALSKVIMDSVVDGIIVLDRTGVVVKVNQAWRRFTDESGPCPHAAAVHASIHSNFLGLCDADVYFASHSEARVVRDGIQAVLDGRLPNFHMEYACQTKLGHRWFSLVATPLAAVRTGAVISNRDVTERKMHEVESLAYQERLEKMVDNSTVQLGALADQLMKTETRERRLLAEDLHDDLGQSLTVIKLKLQSMKFSEQFEKRKQMLYHLEEIESMVDRSSQSVRSISTHLSPPVLSQDGLQAALDWLAEEMCDTYGLTVHLEWDVAIEIDVDLAGAIYRTVRELLINVWKHADTDSAQVCVRSNTYSGMITVDVVDEGKGFDVREIQRPSTKLSYGLFSIRERMSLIGATFNMDSAPGTGTRAVLMVPARALRHRMKVSDRDSTIAG